MLDVLRLAGRREPLVLAIDDAQWLDRSSLAVVAFALRRLAPADRVAILAARRIGVQDDPSRLLVDSVEPELRTIVPVGPLSLGATHRLYRRRLGLSLPRPRLLQVHELCGGNLFALEIGRALDFDPSGTRGDLPLPASLSVALEARLSALSPAARLVALLAAAAAEPTSALLAASSGLSDPHEAVAELVEAGVLAVSAEGLRFYHPLLASAAYGHGSDAERRAAHAALARVVAAPEERARHLVCARDPRREHCGGARRRSGSRRGARGSGGERRAPGVGRTDDTRRRRRRRRPRRPPSRRRAGYLRVRRRGTRAGPSRTRRVGSRAE